mgnify:CR=1 FL=1
MCMLYNVDCVTKKRKNKIQNRFDMILSVIVKERKNELSFSK